ncbi:hypothetical protein, partial [Nitrosomonas communis]|uniref:hypothetical protein n=1 Tax=Nitrosomonas communis TaxID=44574 RepID=UPI0026EE5D4D
SLPRLLIEAARGGLKPSPVTRLRGAYPHLSCSIAARRTASFFAPSWHTIVVAIACFKPVLGDPASIMTASIRMENDSRGWLAPDFCHIISLSNTSNRLPT